jgi:hypothetical protein
MGQSDSSMASMVLKAWWRFWFEDVALNGANLRGQKC